MASKTDFAILGVLNQITQGTGYDIKKYISQTFSEIWDESYGQIYPALKRLEQEKLVTRSSVKSVKTPDKNLYNITEAGKKYFGDWLYQKPLKQKIRDELLLKIFFSTHVEHSTPVLELHIRNLLGETKENIKRYRKYYDMVSTSLEISDVEKSRYIILINWVLEHAKTTRSWCKKTLKTLALPSEKL